jgi:hypothetical protein
MPRGKMANLNIVPGWINGPIVELRYDSANRVVGYARRTYPASASTAVIKKLFL